MENSERTVLTFSSSVASSVLLVLLSRRCRRCKRNNERLCVGTKFYLITSPIPKGHNFQSHFVRDTDAGSSSTDKLTVVEKS